MTHKLDDRLLVLPPFSLFWLHLSFVTWIDKYTRTRMRTSKGKTERKKMAAYGKRHELSEAKREVIFSFSNNLHRQHHSQNISSGGLRRTSRCSLLWYWRIIVSKKLFDTFTFSNYQFLSSFTKLINLCRTTATWNSYQPAYEILSGG
jgi:hypothetical protein